MRILHVLDHSLPLHSGYTFRTREILRQQRLLGWETFHLTSPKHGLGGGCRQACEEADGLLFYRTPVPSLAGVPLLGQLAVSHALERRLLSLAGELAPDIIHAHSPALNGRAALRVARRLGIPFVYEIRAFWEDAAVDHGTSRENGLRYRLTRMLETHVVSHADHVTTICEGLRRDIISRGIDPGRVTVIPNAVDIDEFPSDPAGDETLARAPGPGDGLVLGFIGSFYAYEGLDILLQALPEILRGLPDVRVLLVGGGPEEQNLKRLACRLGLEKVVEFTGRVDHGRVREYYRQMDIMVYPRHSMRLTELVTPLKPLEAMANCRLVIASDVGGHRELIRDRQTGWLFRAGDPSALARAVLALEAAREDWPRLRAAGRRFVEEERNWPASVARYRSIYDSLVRRAR